jgi:hypothetical protein
MNEMVSFRLENAEMYRDEPRYSKLSFFRIFIRNSPLHKTFRYTTNFRFRITKLYVFCGIGTFLPKGTATAQSFPSASSTLYQTSPYCAEWIPKHLFEFYHLTAVEFGESPRCTFSRTCWHRLKEIAKPKLATPNCDHKYRQLPFAHATFSI